MTHSLVIAIIALVSLYGILNAGRIGWLRMQRDHFRRDRDIWREEATHWRNDASEQSQIIGRLRRSGL